MKIKLITYLLLITAALWMLSCTKPEQNFAAECLIDSPSEGSIIALPDTLWVKFTLSSEQPITALEVGIMNADYIPLTPTIQITLTDTSNYFNIPFVVGLLESSEMEKAYITIKLETTGQSFSWFRMIQLINKPLLYNGLILTTRAENDEWFLTATDTKLGISNRLSIAGTIKKAAILTEQDLTLLATKPPEKLMAMRNADFQVLWTTEAGMPYPDITFVYPHHPMVYYGEGNGKVVSAFAFSGLKHTTTLVPYNMYAENMAFSETLFVVTAKSRTGETGKIITCYSETGAIKHMYPDDFRMVAGFANATKDLFTLFGNLQNQGVIYLFDAEENQVATTFPTPAGTIINTIKSGISSFLVHIGNSIYTFDPSTNSWNKVLETPLGINDICLSTDFTTLFVATGNELIEYTYPNLSEVRRAAYDKQVLKVMVRYLR